MNCYCTVCIGGLIDDFWGDGGGGSPKKFSFIWGGGVMKKKFNDWGGGSCNFLVIVQKIPPAPLPRN